MPILYFTYVLEFVKIITNKRLIKLIIIYGGMKHG